MKYLDENREDYNDEQEKELNRIGFQGLYSKVMFMVLDVAPVLEKEIESVASEEFKLRTAFNNAYASSLGSEYPFDTMTDEMEVVKIGEEIYNKYPESKLFKEIKEKFMRAVSYFTDFHVVTHSNGSDPDYIVGGLDVHMYPAGSYKSNFESFVKSLPDSKYNKIVRQMLDYPSVITSKDDDSVYLVLIHSSDDYKEAEKIIFDFINEGIDIPHNIIVRDGENVKKSVVYRFF